MKIVHIVENLHRNAVETWLVRMFEECRKLQQDDVWTFYCTWGQPGRHDELVRKLGGRIIYSPVPLGRRLSFLWALRQTLKREHFDILHCHHDLVSGCYLLAALGLPIRQRIVHVHNTDEELPTPNRFKYWLLKEPLRRACFFLSDSIVGISRHVLQTFLKGRKLRRGRDEVLYYGSNFWECLQQGIDPVQLRNDLNLPPHTRLVLFLGRLTSIKNPLGALEVFAELNRRRSDVACLFAGQGDLANAIRLRAVELGISDRVHLLGWSDTPFSLMQACDLFLFPRLEHNIEGFGFAVLEAQAAGLAVLTSFGVSDEVIVFPERTRRIALTAGVDQWAATADELLNRQRPGPRNVFLTLQNTPFAKEVAAKNLLALYKVSRGNKQA